MQQLITMTQTDLPGYLGHYRNSLLTYSPKMEALDEVIALGHYGSSFESKVTLEGGALG